MNYDYIINLLEGVNEPIIFEIGAYDCKDAIELSKIAGSLVYAWECDPYNLSLINSLTIPPNIVLVKKAVNDQIGKVWFYVVGNGSTSPCSSILRPLNNCGRPKHIKNFGVVECESLTLDYYCDINNIKHIDLLCADIQGGEYKMILGGQKILKNTKYVVIEIMGNIRYDGYIIDINEFIKILPGDWKFVRKMGFDCVFSNLELL